MELRDLQKKAVEIRQDLLTLIFNGKTGHTGGDLSSVDLMVALHYHIMNLKPEDPDFPERDRFILSKGHCVECYYAVLADLGFFPKEELKTFSTYQSPFIGHPTNKIPGIEVNTGALGHGLSLGAGMAYGLKQGASPSRVFVVTGDGELAEGSVWEAAMFASHYHLDNLIWIVDRNHLQISGNTEDVMSHEPLKQRMESFGWAVETIEDGNSMEQLVSALEQLPVRKGKPSAFIADTVKGKGVKEMENIAKWHHGVPDEQLYASAMAQLDAIRKELDSHE